MATFTNHKISDMTTDVIVAPVPARVKKKNKENLFDVTRELFDKYKLSYERYKEFSREKEPFSNGQIAVCRDANFSDLSIDDPETPIEKIVDRIENNSRFILLLPVSKTDQHDPEESIYLACFRSFRLLLDNEEVKEHVKSVSIPNFPGFRLVLDKVEEIFSDLDIEIFVCLDNN